MEEHYHAHTVETTSQQDWEKHHDCQVTEDIDKEKFYCLSMFPYPSGQLHIGHIRVYTLGDVIARYEWIQGKNVMQPMGWDSFGLPAENAATKHHISPAQWTEQNIANMRTHMQQFGFGYDWQREITTCSPEYYRWEQWFFLTLYEKGLAYKKHAIVNWDPLDKTVLANEQVINGRGWRSQALIERRAISQWFLKITAYAEELLTGLDTLPGWPEQVKTMQRNWIGRSSGAEISFTIDQYDPLTVFTTRPDTLFGVTYLAIAPEHPLAKQMAQHNPQLQAFLTECTHLQTTEAALATIEKQGISLGLSAHHPLTGEILPIWVANFVIMEYGSGCVMAVPAHDKRDFEFAIKYHLPIKPVLCSTAAAMPVLPYTELGILVDSAEFTGLDSHTAMQAIVAKLATRQLGKPVIHYRLRDWCISRQRYWGVPIPIINCAQCGPIAVPDDQLPVLLPIELTVGEQPPTLQAHADFMQTSCPRCHQAALRETDTFDTFMESSWYYARFACNKQNKAMLDGRANYWLPVDQYVGGIEHAVLHLLYARFFHKLLRDAGLLNTHEPFTRLLAQGMVLNQGAKMSKSKGNIIEPLSLLEQYGADTVRLFLMFAAPPEHNLEWSDSGIEGSARFLKRLWALAYRHHPLIQAINAVDSSLQWTSSLWEAANDSERHWLYLLYHSLQQAKHDYDRQQFNTVVSACMKIFNLLSERSALTPVTAPSAPSTQDIHNMLIQHGTSILLRLLAPITPHIAYQLWQALHYPGNILFAPWPKANPIITPPDQLTLVIQINGKLRGHCQVAAMATVSEIEHAVLLVPSIQPFLQGKEVKKIITVPGKLVNIVL